MTAAEYQERKHELYRRGVRAMRLGDAVPAVSTEACELIIDLLGELQTVIDELAKVEASR